jgi:hypothetical protein
MVCVQCKVDRCSCEVAHTTGNVFALVAVAVAAVLVSSCESSSSGGSSSSCGSK